MAGRFRRRIADPYFRSRPTKILVATDGSKPALHAVKYVVKLLRSLSSTSNFVTLISGRDDLDVVVGNHTLPDYVRKLIEKELKPARKLLDAA